MLKPDATRKPAQVEHLVQVRALSLAIASAISAIEKNDLREFEAQLAIQERICNRIAATGWTAQLTGPQKAAENEVPDAALLQEIRQAYVALAQLNRVYAALLKRARRSFGLIAALYRSHGEGYHRGPSPLPNHTWSCEV